MKDIPLLVIAGATATGKTEAAVALAKRLDGEIVGADSVQVYRGFDIGSAKPKETELDGIAHHLIDVVDPNEPLDAMAFARLADEAIAGVRGRGRVPIVVGGTGLWLRALVRGLVDLPPVDTDVRASLEAEVKAKGSATLHARLVELDPRAASAIHQNDAVRIVRALEVHAQTGVPLGELRARHALGGNRYPTLFIVLERPLDELTSRIVARTDAMLAAGWLDEVRALRATWGDEVRALSSVGYRQLLEHLRDGVTWEETLRALHTATRTYARRQRNWFRAEPGIDVRISTDALHEPAMLRRIEAHVRP